MKQCGSSCWPAERGASAALHSIQQIMTVVLRRKLNVKLLSLISAKWSTNYIQKLGNPATFSCLSLSPLSWPMKTKEDTDLARPLPSITASSSSSSSASLQISLSLKVETGLMSKRRHSVDSFQV